MATRKHLGKHVIAKNRAAHYEYFIDETFVAGIELKGAEVRSLRERAAQITEAFVLVRDGQAWLHGMHISPYSHGNRWNANPDRKKRLLLHKKEIRYLAEHARNKGVAIIPLELFFDSHNRAKLFIGLGRGKKLYDKRHDIARRDSEREIARALKAHFH